MNSLPRDEAASEGSPLVVALDRGLLRVDTRDEALSRALFREPLAAIPALLFKSAAEARRRLCERYAPDPDRAPVREAVVEWAAAERARGRRVLVAGQPGLAAAVAQRLGVFDGVIETGQPTPLPEALAAPPADWRDWLRAFRPHQWSKNVLVLAPLALGLHQLTVAGLLRTIAALLCLCALASLTYLINDAADIESDRRHWSKHRRPLASGAVSVRAALTTAFVGIPLVLATAWLVSPAVALCLLLYTLITLAYSFALKSIPLVDAMTVGSLFTLRLALGVAAGGLAWSAWLLTFGACFFFSLTLAKRHTELVRAGPGAALVPGRGYRADDKALTLAYGIATATASVLLIALYIVEEVFPRAAYAHPQWLWFAPPVLFAWSSRVWLLAHRGHMHDDPVVFALRDRVSWALGGVLAVAFLLALA